MISRTSAVAITQGLKEHVILGTDVRDIQVQKDRWLGENPNIKIIETGDIKREPASLLIRFGGKRVPRFSMFLRYREETSSRCNRHFNPDGGAGQRQDKSLGRRKPAPPLKFPRE